MAHVQLFRAYYVPNAEKHIKAVLQELSDSVNEYIKDKDVVNVDLTTSHLGNGHTEYVISVLTKN